MSEENVCLTASDLLAYSTGRLSRPESSRITLHVDRCPRC